MRLSPEAKGRGLIQRSLQKLRQGGRELELGENRLQPQRRRRRRSAGWRLRLWKHSGERSRTRLYDIGREAKDCRPGEEVDELVVGNARAWPPATGDRGEVGLTEGKAGVKESLFLTHFLLYVFTSITT